ncbi:hypothetical protein SIN8267_00932 [Sinobacterium norvegicum]|uniref:Cbb3-type cytochrome oxidase assembly protein CcoS n=1 Tax=Sinobacterium norvegicum TaxID=1641715 RepID=A0ABN8EIY9_9GAMM|nr:cbb3-type cytochrome oxidase assembly protein CcoS [Sinobacterium norvegicum]CAH0990832.1 hypothetical protein SIN8267_00932 [Sinobacterium norvegicum]
MESIYILIPVALGFAGVGTWAFFWAVDSDQYEDLDREGQRILFDDNKKDQKNPPKTSQQNDNDGTPQ